MSHPLQDADARRAIREDTDRTLFVEAGAGSGKTRSLVERIHHLVVHDGVPLRRIAAVTFTEKAGAELRDRLRAALEQADGQRAEEALDDLDGAAIGTLHSFAQRILAEHPIEAGLPPLIEVADELSSAVAFEARWAEQRRQLLDDDTIDEPLMLAMSAGVTLDNLRSLAKLFNADWDLVAERVLAGPQSTTPSLTGVEALADRAATLAARADACLSADDKFLPHLARLGAWGLTLAEASDAGLRLAALGTAADLKFSYGQAGNWGGKPALDGLKEECRQLVADAAAAVAAVLEPTLRILSRWIAERVLEAAEKRRDAGRLEFHDLLVIAREVLRGEDGTPVRAALQDRYQRLLLDEFQDTDPIQIELAVRIAGGAAASAERWEDVVVSPGSLFVVGDPKQSIYRFRRADIAMYLRSQRVIGEQVSLTTNFRTVAPVVDWVNAVFDRLIVAEPDRQPAFQPLVPERPAHGGAPAVVVLGAEPHQGLPRSSASTLREREAADVAGVIRRAVAEGWPVHVDGAWRPARLDDVAVLLPARTSLPFLESALNRAGIAYRAESSSLVYEAQEVRDLMAAARAIADPSDALSLVTALRSPLFGCGDDDLWTWKHGGGALSVIAPLDETRSEHPVSRSLAYLQRLHRAARWMAPSEVLTRLVADRRMLEVAAQGPQARDQWRRLRFVVDQARAWAESEHGGLRAYLAWAQQQSGDSSRVAESALPETDAQAVRIMTVHGAKGLEFPIVVMSGMTSGVRRPGGVRVLWTADGYEVSIRKGVTTGDFDLAAPVDEQMDDRERRRLLYVAATRARDHLVVSLHRSAGASQTSAKLLADDGGARSGAEAWSVDQLPADVVPVAAPTMPATPPDRDAWWTTVSPTREASRRTSAISASGLEGSEPAVALGGGDTGLAKGAQNLDLPPWSKGRYGTAIGRAVHAVLQTVDLATGAGLDEAVAAQCAAEGVEPHADVVTALVQSALDSALIREATTQPHWREMYVGAVQADGTILEGIVDLVVRRDDGTLMVVDYKTDAVPSAAIDGRAVHYRPQLASYEAALTAAGSLSEGPRLVFLRPDGVAVDTTI
ncbi:ATP-dependent exoDNAse (exonuclease V) beta subunit (contains helicase and exonuclease domains) [Klenkia soli]|uniref:DNA 3'-5' helicase n=1 Tax=Klenkia soli TaxID=1052260 RepID=A0A1H0Q275_9ACTN|nr:UvrD-helicase domain-containing protein [Klenkia soli]SDP11180.1 ATP-dependent exoDNAse (exonuclease V) beta subunit (contains helicase and exonuclease domains) [Klenkia soli]